MPHSFSLPCRQLPSSSSGSQNPCSFLFSRPPHPKFAKPDRRRGPVFQSVTDSLRVVPPTRRDIASDTPRPHLRSRSTPCSSPLATHDWTIHLSAHPVNPSHTYHQTLSSSSTCAAFCVASNTPFQCCLSPAARPLRDGPKHRTWLPYRAPARKVTMREDGWKGESIKEKVSKMH